MALFKTVCSLELLPGGIKARGRGGGGTMGNVKMTNEFTVIKTRDSSRSYSKLSPRRFYYPD